MTCLLAVIAAALAAQQSPPPLVRDGTASIAAQESPWEPGPRAIRLGIHYPGGRLNGVKRSTGLMLTLHNWGGAGADGTADPKFLVENYDVVAITVDYYQRGKWDPDGPVPYDFGFLQALDALRALHFVYSGLDQEGIRFHKGRIYATGGSGGGNVALMANKLAPRTFACVVDLSGMAKLNDDIAYGLAGGSELDANYSREPARPNYLSPDMREIRFIGNPEHLRQMKSLGNSAVIVVVHGTDDDVCPIADVREMVTNMAEAGLRIDTHLVAEAQVDGEVYKDTRHGLGDRTSILDQVAGKYLRPDSPEGAIRIGPDDFERGKYTCYPTSNGEARIVFSPGLPPEGFLHLHRAASQN